jgi:hypothetical protein
MKWVVSLIGLDWIGLEFGNGNGKKIDMAMIEWNRYGARNAFV